MRDRNIVEEAETHKRERGDANLFRFSIYAALYSNDESFAHDPNPLFFNSSWLGVWEGVARCRHLQKLFEILWNFCVWCSEWSSRAHTHTQAQTFALTGASLSVNINLRRLFFFLRFLFFRDGKLKDENVVMPFVGKSNCCWLCACNFMIKKRSIVRMRKKQIFLLSIFMFRC